MSGSAQKGDIIAGIRENELGALSLEIMGYADRISVIFNRIDAVVATIPAGYRGESCDQLMQSFEKLKVQFPVVKENVKTYADDLVSLLDKMKQIDFDLTKLFQSATDDVNARRGQIDNNENNKGEL